MPKGNYNVCADVLNNKTYYAYYDLLPKTADNVQREVFVRGGWKSDEYAYPTKGFTQKSQKEQFNRWNLDLDGFFENCHFCSFADFEQIEDKANTMLIENSFPCLGKFNRGNCKNIEGKIRKSIENETRIIVGAYGHLTMLDVSSNEVAVTLKNSYTPQPQRTTKKKIESMEVPEFMFKIVIDKVTRESYCTVTFLNLQGEVDFSGEDISERVLVPEQGVFSNLKKGKTIFCPVDDIISFLKTKYNNDLSILEFTEGNIFMDPKKIAKIYEVS